MVLTCYICGNFLQGTLQGLGCLPEDCGFYSERNGVMSVTSCRAEARVWTPLVTAQPDLLDCPLCPLICTWAVSGKWRDVQTEPGGTTQVQGGGAWPLTRRPQPQGRHAASRKPLQMTRVAMAPSVTPTCTVPVTDQPPDPWNPPHVFMLLMEILGSASTLETERGTQGPRTPSLTHHPTIYQAHGGGPAWG